VEVPYLPESPAFWQLGIYRETVLVGKRLSLRVGVQMQQVA
jgi:hypothetical protein